MDTNSRAPAMLRIAAEAPYRVPLVRAAARADLAAYNSSLALDRRPPNLACETNWPADMQRIEALIPASIVPNRVAIVGQRVVLELDYLIQIRTD